jgi:hypothetical protein
MYWRCLRSSQRLVLAALSLLVLLMSINPVKPIWADEFLHFAFGAFDGTREALAAIRASLDGVNHGQTGAYMLLDHWLLRCFGASTFWLRFPSLVAGAFLILSCHVVLDNWRLPVLWRATCLAAVFGQPFLLTFVAEARPYLPLAACAVGALAYYTSDLAERRAPFRRLVGWSSVIAGSLMHPYFIVYWFAAIFCGEAARTPRSLRGVIERVNPALVVVGLTIYAAVAQATWLWTRQTLAFDPLEYLGSVPNAIAAFLSAHFGFLGAWKVPLLGLAVLVAAAATVRQRGRELEPLLGPGLVVVCGLGVSLFLALVSYRSHYWILQRQWIASIALVALGSVGFAYRLLALLRPGPRLVIQVVLLGAIGIQAVTVGVAAVGNWRHAGTVHAKVTITSPPEANPASGAEWVAFANANAAMGGRVWPIFRRYYAR